MPGGRPPTYDPAHHPAVARWMAAAGQTEAQIAQYIGVSAETVRRWKHAHPEFCGELLAGKEPVDAAVESSLLRKALGYTYTETTREAVTDDEGQTKLQVTKVITKHAAPDHRSAVIWLSNRRPEEWRERKEIGIDGELDAKLPPALAKLLEDDGTD